VIEVAAGFFFLAAALLAALWRRARAGLREALDARDVAEQAGFGWAAVVAAVPVTGFRWSRDSAAMPLGEADTTGVGMSYESFLAGLDPADAMRIAASVDRLRQTGTAFKDAVYSPDGNAYALEGRTVASGEAVLWLVDVSPIRRAELARAAAAGEAADLREIVELLPLPVWRRDGRLQVIDCNAAYAAALDADRETVLSEPRELAPDGPQEGPPQRAGKAASGTPQIEMRHVAIGGSRRLLRLVETASRAGGTIGYALDHTEAESAGNELARHINAHGVVLESIHAAVAIYGADKRLKFFNSAFVRLWGLEEEWLSGEPSLDELLERLRDRRRLPEHADARAFKRQQNQLFTALIEPESELLHLPDGRTLSMSVSPHPLGGLVFVYEDVTDRLTLERSYNTLIEVQRETLDNLFEAIAVFGSDGRLKLHNPAYRRIWGLAEADLYGEPHVGDIVEKIRHFYSDTGDWPARREAMIARITTGTVWSGSTERSDGSKLQLATMPLPDGNVLFTGLDVSDTARVERMLRERNEALETAARLKSEFIANVSYELRTPLNAIIGFSEILTNQYFGTLTPRQQEYSRGILESSQRLSQLINDILDLATIEAGYLALETGSVDICDMLEAVAALSRERARMQDVALSVNCPREIGAIEADDRRLKQALFNLVSNAIKFTPPGGSIRLQARADEASGDVILEVIDTGIGIAASDQERVFEKFERGSARNREAGAGLGLSLVKSLIELHDGSVAIQSGVGEGTTVLCRLPAGRRLPTDGTAASAPPVGARLDAGA
jgi:signal transduction histidine kinase/PAS domain-containing protein